MKLEFKQILLLFALSVISASCSTSTEKHAQKEHGLIFDAWQLRYEANHYDVYRPTLIFSEPIKGQLFEIEKEYNWNGKLLKKIEYSFDAELHLAIRSTKSRNNAKYYNTVIFDISRDEGTVWSNCTYHFVFNDGKENSVSFSADMSSGLFTPSTMEESDSIIPLLCGSDSVAVKITYNKKYYEGEYSFIIKGCPTLKEALELNQKRSIQADKETDKAAEKYGKNLEKELKSLLK